SEAEIGIVVFNKPPGYDTREDRTVGPAGFRLRRALRAYYDNEGRADEILFKLPHRGYGLSIETRTLSQAETNSGPTLAATRGAPADYRIEASTVIVTDGQGRELWRYQFDIKVEEDAYAGLSRRRRCSFADIDGDGAIETLFAAWPINYGEIGTRLFC